MRPSLVLALVALIPAAIHAEEVSDARRYTTMFYTAAEAIVHGYEADTHVRIVSPALGGTVWQGVVGAGETALVPTGRGVFTFLSDKKAAILVGTPSSCTAVGYFVRDEEGSFRSDLFYAQLPSSPSAPDCRLLVWAFDEVEVVVLDRTADAELFRGRLIGGGYHEIRELANLGSHVLEFRADRSAISVQVYYDEGFFAAGSDGRGVGTLFYTYVGNITEGVNDLNVLSYNGDAQVEITDVDSGESLWKGVVAPGAIQTLTLAQRKVKVASDIDVSVFVGPYVHYKAGYAEHHYGTGSEGTGIETDFLLTTPEEIWIFSYHALNKVIVIDQVTGKEVWTGSLGAGETRGLAPGYGFYRITSDLGVSVMGGSSSCGGEYSPAAGMFAFDEALLAVVEEIRTQRGREYEAANGCPAPEGVLDAPLSEDEMKRCRDAVAENTGRGNVGAKEVESRLEQLKTGDAQTPSSDPDPAKKD